MTWVVKIGGSLNVDPWLPRWLDLLAQRGAGRTVLVCGGGRFADTVREHQLQWAYDDLAAHNMALLAMAQTAYFLRALNPALHLVTDEADIRPALAQGRTVLWSPLHLLSETANAHTNWSVTSDSIALGLAQRLGASRLWVVKSCTVDPALSLVELVGCGTVDAHFAELAAQGTVPVGFLSHTEVARLQQLLATLPSHPPRSHTLHRVPHQ